jgi:hypothetical protein
MPAFNDEPGMGDVLRRLKQRPATHDRESSC